MRSFFRLLRIAQVLLRYRLDELVDATHLFRPLRSVRGLVAPTPPAIAELPRGVRLMRALEELGPIFVKIGQLLSTRRDLIPSDVADQLALLRDRVAPFDGNAAQVLVERALGEPISKLYRRFDCDPLASASIAQVHAAELADGREVVVKVLRPGIGERIAQDVALLRAFARLAQRHLPDAERIQPLEVVAEIETTLRNELDLQREGANASLLRRNFADSPDLYVPEIVWSHSRESVLTMERVRGIPSDD
ncbi:MAG TPA: AarF/UbiB family protein, partial [Candidatus Saccharimonadia bacterium]|nr:AarF/UbiB family protein [Candidatus Saccharimonadia bacterium]